MPDESTINETAPEAIETSGSSITPSEEFNKNDQSPDSPNNTQSKESFGDKIKTGLAITNVIGAVAAIKSDVKGISANLETATHIITDEIIPFIEYNRDDIDHIKDVIANLNSSDKSNDIDKKDNGKDSNKKDKTEKKGIMSKVAKMVTAVLPSVLVKDKKEHKTNSKLNEKVYNVSINSFSTTANNQLINNLKQVLKIQKKKESFITKSNMIKLAILAFTGMLLYMIFQIKEVRTAFSNWIDKIKDDIGSIKESIVKFFNEQIENFSNIFSKPLSETFDSLVKSFESFKDTVKQPLANILNSFSELKLGLTEAWDAVKNMSGKDIMALFDSAWLQLKISINKLLGMNVFDVEQEIPQDSKTSDDTSIKSDEQSPGSLNTSSQQANKSEENNNIQNNTTIGGDKITNNNLAQNNQSVTMQDGNTNISGSSFRLQNGTIFNLHKNDDIYIANKPGGVIHGIFQEINSNYTNVKNIFIQNFNSIIENIKQQDQQFSNLIDKLQETPQQVNVPPNIGESLNTLQIQLNTLQQSQRSPVTFTGVSEIRNSLRKSIL